jgi:hypothetical protein
VFREGCVFSRQNSKYFHQLLAVQYPRFPEIPKYERAMIKFFHSSSDYLRDYRSRSVLLGFSPIPLQQPSAIPPPLAVQTGTYPQSKELS